MFQASYTFLEVLSSKLPLDLYKAERGLGGLKLYITEIETSSTLIKGTNNNDPSRR